MILFNESISRICRIILGAFLIPYLFSLAFVAMPVFLMELAFGQFASVGTISIWKICPILAGETCGLFII